MARRQTTKWYILTALILFMGCLCVGNWLAQRKPLWNDEIFTQERSIDQKSYMDIVLVRLEEGNNCPLFYLIQKGICDLWQYRLPQKWEGEWHIGDVRAQKILRISSNVFMSLSIVFIFYFFARIYSGGAGCYALLVTLSSYMVWAYWVEARPYTLWFFLTTVQSLLFLRITGEKKPPAALWTWLSIIHVLLSLTVILSLAQIVIVSSLLWVFQERDWKKHLFLTAIPAALSLFYYFHSPPFRFWIKQTPLELIAFNIPVERLLLSGVFAVFLLFSYGKRKPFGQDLYRGQAHLEARRYLIFVILMLAATAVIFMVFKLRARPDEVFLITNRYFIYLTPAGIIATVLFSVSLVRAFKEHKWILINIIIGLSGLLVIRLLRTYGDLIVRGLY